ncbi:MAG TPA: cyclic nucleotide-binding domain-containing protein [Acidimicrobiales bacterium]|nr:cyclic nucleotide-binding domain-containing protein [Acidimicrobiales bacterium]
MKKRDELVDVLADVPLFSACTKSDLRIIARHATEVQAPVDTILVQEGEPADTFFVLLNGEASVRRKGGAKRSRRVATLGAGSYFGELALLDPAPRNATVAATTPVTLAAISARVFRTLLRDVPAMNEKLLTSMARRLRETDGAAPTE